MTRERECRSLAAGLSALLLGRGRVGIRRRGYVASAADAGGDTLQGGAVQVGWLNSARWLPYLILGLVVGALVDRTHRRPVMVATNVTRAVLLALIPLAWVLDLLTFPLLLVVVSNDPATMRSRRLRESALWGNLAHTRHSEVR